ncbi:MAG: hypothetical protein HRU40_07065 [Saprospiraceae bacterium]|nr:hypothetical protein [Saprospiraceae bacterium]
MNNNKNSNVIECRLLIVDDNPFSAHKYVSVLLKQMGDGISEEFESYFKKLKVMFSGDRKENARINSEMAGSYTINLPKKKTCITFYHYNVYIDEVENRKNIVELITNQKINTFWSDRGFSAFECHDNKLQSINDDNDVNSTTVDALLEGDNYKILEALSTNEVKQIALHTHNPDLLHREIETKRSAIYKNLKGVIEKNNIYYFEMSSVLNIFSAKDKLTKKVTDKVTVEDWLGTTDAFKLYGNLLGNIMFDLWSKIIKPSNISSRYNFFKEENRDFKRFKKVLDKNKVFEDDIYLGLVSFEAKLHGKDQYVIDFPYKEYYKYYDEELLKIEGIESLFELNNSKTDNDNDNEKWIYYHYNYSNSANQIHLSNHLSSTGNPTETEKKFLRLLHTAIFYTPDVYSCSEVKLPDFVKFKDNKDSCEIFYLYKKIAIEGLDGLLHLAFWRRKRETEEFDFTHIQGIVDNMWENYVPLIEPKVEQNVIPLIIEQVKNNLKRLLFLK